MQVGEPGRGGQPELGGERQRTGHLAEGVELELLDSSVADPDRPRPLVSGEMGELELGEAS